MIFILMCLLGQKFALSVLPIYIVFSVLVGIRASQTTVISWVCLKPGTCVSEASQRDFVVAQSLVFS